MATYRDTALAALTFWEKPTPWIYRDSKGFATTATGDMIPTVMAACGYPFIAANGSPATAAQITAEYQRVMAMPVGMVASAYRIPTALMLSQTWIRQRLSDRVNAFEVQLRKIYPAYDSQPDAAKVGEIDMVFNLGFGQVGPPATGLHEYKIFNASILRKDYLSASDQCARNASTPAFNDRNRWTQRMFVYAASGMPPQLPNGCVPL